MFLHPLVFVLAGLIALYLGATSLVKGSASLALRLGLSPLVIGLTVVAFATSTPELFVVLKASFEGREGISIGNVVGANMLNTGLILGLTAIISPLRVQFQLIVMDVPIMIAAAAALYAVTRDGDIAVGNVVGSSIFNVFCILGIAATMRPLDASGVTRGELLAMIALALLVLPVMWRGHVISRAEGGLLVAGYCGALAYVLSA